MSLVFSLGLALQRQTRAQVPIPPAPPTNIALPVISGAAVSGATLTADTGTWTNSPTGYVWQWRRGGTSIAGATAASYALQTADVGSTITVRVSATNAAGSAAAVSAATAAVTAGAAAPANTVLPGISGLAQVGQTLTGTLGTWTGTPTPTLSGEWRRGATTVGTGLSYVVQAADLGARLAFRVTGTNSGGSSSATSAETAAVTSAAGAAPVNTALPVIAGQAVEGQTLTAGTGTWANSPTGYAYQWRRGSLDIPGATQATFTPGLADVDAGLGVRVTATNAQGAAAATSATTPPVRFAFELLNETGSALITSVPNLRVSLDGGTTWLSLAGAGLAVARHADGDKLVVSGWASTALRDAALFHYEHRVKADGTAVTNLGEEPNSPPNSLFALYVRARTGASPQNAQLPGGLQLSATIHDQPVGVTA